MPSNCCMFVVERLVFLMSNDLLSNQSRINQSLFWNRYPGQTWWYQTWQPGVAQIISTISLFAEVQERNWWLADDTCLTDSGANGRGRSLFLFSPVEITSRSAWLPLSMHGYTNSSQRRLSSDRHPSISIHSARCMKPPEPDQQHNSKYKHCCFLSCTGNTSVVKQILPSYSFFFFHRHHDSREHQHDLIPSGSILVQIHNTAHFLFTRMSAESLLSNPCNCSGAKMPMEHISVGKTKGCRVSLSRNQHLLS